MRLLKWDGLNNFVLTGELGDNVPPYAILSHTWGSEDDEVNYDDLQKRRGQSKPGYAKIQFCGEQARRDGIDHFWVDTCCINKQNLTELTEAVNSMFRWYRHALRCYVYLADVASGPHSITSSVSIRASRDAQSSSMTSLQRSRWFTRGWTLQELLAPSHVEFFSCEGSSLGTKTSLAPLIHQITSIPLAAIEGAPLDQFPVTERMRWTENRQTSKIEDRAYCLFGIFNVFLPPLYGERDYAFRRLEKEIRENSGTDVRVDDRVVKIRPLGLCLTSAPLMQSNHFIGRVAELEEVHRILQPVGNIREQRRVVLGGMGGVGKTQLAIAYARQYQNTYGSVLWLNATSELSLYTSLRPMASMMIVASELEKLDMKQMLTRVLRWLASSHDVKWLLIFDNYDDPDQFEIDGFCPHSGHGSILITTRRPDMVTGQQMKVLPLHDIYQSLSILQTRSERRDVKDNDGAHLLAKRLDGLPLALATAGAYLRRSTISFQQYVDIYEQCWRQDHSRRLPQFQDYRDRTLFTTWNVSYNRLKTGDPDATRMLTLLAYFDPQETWYDLFLGGLSNHSPRWLRKAVTERIRFESLMGTLVDFCLIEVQHAKQSYGMHRCLHDWTIWVLNQSFNVQLYWYAFDCVAASIDDENEHLLSLVKYAPVSRHAVRLTQHRIKLDNWLSDRQWERLGKMSKVAELLRQQCQLDAAEQVCQRALAGLEKTLGPNHEAVVSTSINLGVVYIDQGKLNEAEHTFQRAHIALTNSPTANLDYRLTVLNNLGRIYSAQGKLELAHYFWTLAFIGYDKLFGPENHLVFDTFHNLGSLSLAQGNLEEAEDLFSRAYGGYERLLGEKHPSTLETIHDLGLVHMRQGRIREAWAALCTAAVGSMEVLGTEHSSTVRMMGDLYLFDREHGDKLSELEATGSRPETPVPRPRNQLINFPMPTASMHTAVGMAIALLAILIVVCDGGVVEIH